MPKSKKRKGRQEYRPEPTHPAKRDMKWVRKEGKTIVNVRQGKIK